MILCDINQATKFVTIHPLLGEAIEWLTVHAGDVFEKGIVNIGTGGCIMVKCEEPHMQPLEKAELEAHRRFIDIHVPLKDKEMIGWASVQTLKYPHGEYDADKDVCFFGDTPGTLLQVRVGQMAIFFPEDAHAPNIGIGSHRKLCIKIPVETK